MPLTGTNLRWCQFSTGRSHGPVLKWHPYIYNTAPAVPPHLQLSPPPRSISPLLLPPVATPPPPRRRAAPLSPRRRHVAPLPPPPRRRTLSSSDAGAPDLHAGRRRLLARARRRSPPASRLLASVCYSRQGSRRDRISDIIICYVDPLLSPPALPLPSGVWDSWLNLTTAQFLRDFRLALARLLLTWLRAGHLNLNFCHDMFG